MSKYNICFIFSSEQADQLEEVHSQLTEVRAEADRLRTERARLADAAASARHWRDEADAGQQAIIQLRESERTCEKLKQNLEAALYYRVSHHSIMTILFPDPMSRIERGIGISHQRARRP